MCKVVPEQSGILFIFFELLQTPISESMTLEPEKFRLSLERPSQPGHLKPDGEAVCLVTASDSFTPQVGLLLN